MVPPGVLRIPGGGVPASARCRTAVRRGGLPGPTGALGGPASRRPAALRALRRASHAAQHRRGGRSPPRRFAAALRRESRDFPLPSEVVETPARARSGGWTKYRGYLAPPRSPRGSVVCPTIVHREMRSGEAQRRGAARAHIRTRARLGCPSTALGREYAQRARSAAARGNAAALLACGGYHVQTTSVGKSPQRVRNASAHTTITPAARACNTHTHARVRPCPTYKGRGTSHVYGTAARVRAVRYRVLMRTNRAKYPDMCAPRGNGQIHDSGTTQ